MAIGVHVFGREGRLPGENSRIVVTGDNIGARDIMNGWTAEGPVMCCILRILHDVCQMRNVRVWMFHVSTKDNFVADGLSRSPNFQNSSPMLNGEGEVDPRKQLESWIRSIVKTARSRAAHTRKASKDQGHDKEAADQHAPDVSGDKLAIE